MSVRTVEGFWSGKEIEKGLILSIDGASRGNPGEAAVGVVMEEIRHGRSGVVREVKKTIGVATNNVAEYKALLLGLEEAKDLYQGGQITILTDSQLLQCQIQGKYRTHNDRLKRLLTQVIEALHHFEEWRIFHIPREENGRAHRLAHQALMRER
ncbi:ribonuclease HI family protein [candidate division TA06 bacterium]|nr:ribonuclease HI family protein [candidate division TA06 bacterium]